MLPTITVTWPARLARTRRDDAQPTEPMSESNWSVVTNIDG